MSNSASDPSPAPSRAIGDSASSAGDGPEAVQRRGSASRASAASQRPAGQSAGGRPVEEESPERRGAFLTRRQKEILDFIADFHRRHGVAPTHREIRDNFGYSSYGTVYKHLKLLQQKGFLHRDWNQKRGLVLQPDPQLQAEVVREIPFYGRIAAGQPLEAIRGEDRLAVPHHLLPRRPDECYVLEVVGESMIDEGIHDGDLVVVERRERAQTGEMVVALVEAEATLKRFYPEGERVRLQPSNPTMEPIYVSAESLRIQGAVVGLMRRF